MILNLGGIKKLIPHRPPILLVDRVLKVGSEPPSIQAEKDVEADAPFLAGHFPGNPIMPGVLMIEALAQTGLLCLFHLKLVEVGWPFYFAGIERAKFRRAVFPGDCMRLDVKFLQGRRNYWKMEGEVRVGGEVAAEAVLSAMFRPEERS